VKRRPRIQEFYCKSFPQPDAGYNSTFCLRTGSVASPLGSHVRGNDNWLMMSALYELVYAIYLIINPATM